MGGVSEKEALLDLDRLDVDRFGDVVRCALAVRVGAAAARRVRERDRDAERSAGERDERERLDF